MPKTTSLFESFQQRGRMVGKSQEAAAELGRRVNVTIEERLWQLADAGVPAHHIRTVIGHELGDKEFPIKLCTEDGRELARIWVEQPAGAFAFVVISDVTDEATKAACAAAEEAGLRLAAGRDPRGGASGA